MNAVLADFQSSLAAAKSTSAYERSRSEFVPSSAADVSGDKVWELPIPRCRACVWRVAQSLTKQDNQSRASRGSRQTSHQ
ncbi:uncharacterized protein PHALS_03550 [Plasmopara halstedii]|uniref:Uncharacterized protein n=1 Tax=Plasmopara halstedii TaxID=4781 RepID=A0A0P1AZJ3_PLAHL|nr:uncharacterized protein PHALS_03550 [Plasmopara halstedii]CEG46876.1 hypothetical protein PHALS_03550 [Plasmopara halstedii]|eukprot:XP_024583245.1 hypothetical protein PHALS_03550 [Plasmopara halstedii]